jgi:hypothetical protein
MASPDRPEALFEPFESGDPVQGHVELRDRHDRHIRRFIASQESQPHDLFVFWLMDQAEGQGDDYRYPSDEEIADKFRDTDAPLFQSYAAWKHVARRHHRDRRDRVLRRPVSCSGRSPSPRTWRKARTSSRITPHDLTGPVPRWRRRPRGRT